jgi:hypothetical protein
LRRLSRAQFFRSRNEAGQNKAERLGGTAVSDDLRTSEAPLCLLSRAGARKLTKHCRIHRVWVANQKPQLHVAEQGAVHTNQILIGHNQMHAGRTTSGGDGA